MPRDRQTDSQRPRLPAFLCLATLAAAPAVLEAAPESASNGLPACRCDLRVVLDPGTGELRGSASFRFASADRFLSAEGRLPLALHPALELLEASSAHDDLAFARVGDVSGQPDGRRVWSVEMGPARSGAPLELSWSGVLREDLAAGEEPGRIHNTRIRAHVGEEGVYLAPEAAWHPVLSADRMARWEGPDSPACLWTLEASAPARLVASAERTREEGGTSAWRTHFPLPALALAGGSLEVFAHRADGVRLRALLRPASAPFAQGLLEAVAAYLELYQPLIGPYPFGEFTVVESFFSSGFAFPGFTLLSSTVIRMGERGLRPGYLDHELLHSWWGNGVLASQRSGHWSEALASYCANYMRPVLEGRAGEARARRRSVAETLSGNPVLAGQAVGDFGLDTAVSDFVGYQKGALVFAQLAELIGQERLWAGLRRFYRDRFGLPSTWDDLRAAFEAETGRDLDPFFDFWVDGPGLPAPRLGHARWDPGAREVAFEVSYGEPLAIDLPLRLLFDDHATTRTVTLTPGSSSIRLAAEDRPLTVEVDPEFRTLRRLPQDVLMPTLSGLAPPTDLVLVADEGDLEGYGPVRSLLERRYRDDGRVLHRERFSPRLLDRGHVMILGRAVLDEAVHEIFAPRGIDVWERGFEVEPVRYVNPGDSLLACVRNPRRSGAFVCLYRGNGDEALVRTYLVSFYGGSSLLVFDRGRPWERRDFERIERLEVR